MSRQVCGDCLCTYGDDGTCGCVNGFQPLKPRNLGCFVDVETKGAQQEAVDLVEAYIKKLEAELTMLKQQKTLEDYRQYLYAHGHLSDAHHVAMFQEGKLI